MIRLVACLIAMAFMFCAGARPKQQRDGTADLSGVVKGPDGAPVVLHLRALDENPVRYYDGYEEHAAKDGSFHFARIAPGAYQLEAEASGFAPSLPQPITLRAGAARKDVVISLAPRSGYSLCGRVTENGKPKDNTWVWAYRYLPESKTFSATFVPHTGHDGSFTIPDVTPGMYYLEGYTTFYPGSFSFNGAKPILVGDGKPTGCSLEIPLQYTGCQTSKVSGRIAPSPDDPNGTYRILFLEANAAGGAMPATIVMMANNVYKPGDSFSGSVCAGSYDIVLSDGQPFGEWKDAPPHKVVIASQHVDVGATAIDGLELSPLAMATISGEVPGMTHNVSCPGGGPRVRVSIFRAGDGQSQTVQLDDKNRFSFHNVAPGEYTIYIGPLAREKFYLDSILVDGNPIDGRKFTLAEARPVNIVVNISADVAHAAGHLSPDVRREPRWEVAWTRPKASVAGKVPSASEPDVTVKLRAIRYNSNASAEYVAHLNADGSFLFDSVDPGVYTLRAEGQGRVAVEYGAREAGERGTPIVLARGAHLQGLTLSSPLLSAICGRVSDSQGAAQAGKRIWLQWNQGGIVFGGSTGTEAVMTDADGRFRVNGVAPGEYFISSPLNVNRVVFFSPDGSLRAATAIRVEPGKDVGCGSNAALDLRVPPNYKKEYAFSGKIAGDLPAAIGDRFLVVLADVRASGARSFVGTSKVDAEHRFSFDRIPGGRFLLELHSAYGPEPVTWSGPYGPVSHLLAAQTIDVNDELKEVNITPMQLPTVTGTVHFSHVPEEWKNNFAVANQTITLRPAVYSAPFSSKLAADGTFSIGPEDVGDYEVDLNLRGPLYLKSVRLGGREVQGRYLHFAAGASPKLEIEVSDDSAQVHAQVVPEAALPAAEPSVEETCSPGARPSYHVVLFPDPLFVRQDVQPEPGSASVVQPRLYHGMQDGDDPSFQLVQGAPPGHYRVLALQGPGVLGYTLGSRAAPTDLEQSLWSALAALGEPITLEAGGNVKLMLLDKTVDADRLAAKLGIPLEHSLLTW